MDISLIKAGLKDAKIIYGMQIKSFMVLLERYQDFETSPGSEPIEKIIGRINQLFTDYYIIKNDGVAVGGVRVVKKDNKHYRVSPIFIIPEQQGNGIAQKVFQMIEHLYSDAKVWELDTILQEQGNCYLYEKLGYKKTGKTEIINNKMTLVFYEKQLTRCV
ncbi:GNAT family N-acetyltransferase [Clostridium bowmanii]|uniref:GNAT family N-acetyltransferase n=1 Tax=Clostridium bowmanii TaxID=132925 RepID=UPI001C0C194A|nr:GNAT family N-acetyltransferase [Clostridium bowmanii]MBU3189336.1 GNAT family N-acetyltransferase [Clostridium bowmanii]MCA1073952.1 GNAT family N-acetyltransferase [Clostridium bowmanii]